VALGQVAGDDAALHGPYPARRPPGPATRHRPVDRRC
jgi:hypothetical protein